MSSSLRVTSLLLLFNAYFALKSIISPSHYMKQTIKYRSQQIFNENDNNDCCDPIPTPITSETYIDNSLYHNDAFIINKSSNEVALEEISDENIVLIATLQTSDNQANELAWKCLGYRYDEATTTYNNDLVFPKWKGKFPTPPDLLGTTRIYDPRVDLPVRTASMVC